MYISWIGFHAEPRKDVNDTARGWPPKALGGPSPHLLIEMTLSFSSSNRDASIEGLGSQCPRGWSGDSEVQLCVGERSMSQCDRYARTYNSSVCDVRKCHRKPAATVNMSACLLLPTIQKQQVQTVLSIPRPKHRHVSGGLSREAMWQLLGKRISKNPLDGRELELLEARS